MNAPDPVQPCTPPKPTGNGGAGRVDSEGKRNSDSENSDEPQSAMTKRKWNGRESWTNANSHDDDKSKYLKYDQIVAI
jgi:hypothetical protein